MPRVPKIPTHAGNPLHCDKRLVYSNYIKKGTTSTPILLHHLPRGRQGMFRLTRHVEELVSDYQLAGLKVLANGPSNVTRLPPIEQGETSAAVGYLFGEVRIFIMTSLAQKGATNEVL